MPQYLTLHSRYFDLGNNDIDCLGNNQVIVAEMGIDMTEETQLLKGILEGCVLGVIERGETYGYEILSELERYGFEELGEGTLYPILTRLDKHGYIRCRKAKSPLGPIRKYYSITSEGSKRLAHFKEAYQKVTASARMILFGEEKNGGEDL